MLVTGEWETTGARKVEGFKRGVVLRIVRLSMSVCLRSSCQKTSKAQSFAYTIFEPQKHALSFSLPAFLTYVSCCFSFMMFTIVGPYYVLNWHSGLEAKCVLYCLLNKLSLTHFLGRVQSGLKHSVPRKAWLTAKLHLIIILWNGVEHHSQAQRINKIWPYYFLKERSGGVLGLSKPSLTE